MTVKLTSPVLGLAVGADYTGNLESWLLNEGYATSAATLPDAWANDPDGIRGGAKPTVVVTPTAAVLVASVAAAGTVGTNGSIEFATKGGVRTSVALLSADTAAEAATKIDTALAGLADAAIVSTKLNVTSTATGTTAYVSVVGGTAAVLTALGVSVDDTAYGGDGRPTGASNLGAQTDLPVNDPTDADNREAPYFPQTEDQNWSIANDADNLTELKFPLARFDFDQAGTDTEAPVVFEVSPNEGPEEGGTVVVISGDNLEGVTGVTFDAVAGTDLDVDNAGDGTITVTTPAGTAGPATVVVTDAVGADTEVGAFTYLATP